MQMDKVILRAILSTLAAIGVLIAIMALVCAFLFPSTLMTLSYNLGMEKSAVRYAERAYKRDGGAYYVACAFEISVGEGKDADIEKFGEELIQNAEFLDYCKKIDEDAPETVTGSYAQYVYGNTYAAEYRNAKTAEEKIAAFDKAFACVEGFPQNNAVVKVLLSALRRGDLTSADYALNGMLALRVNGASLLSDADKQTLDEIISLAQRYVDGGE